MAINIPIISDFTDKGIKDARIAFDKFKTDVDNAEGVMGKFKAGSTAALDYVKANAGTFALAAGGALATFAGKAIGAFQDIAIQAGDFASKTGLAIEDASRWREVAGDLGINTDEVAGAIGRMNKAISSDPKLVRDLGDDIAYTNEGGVDVNETFLNVIQRLKDIKDPTERAKEGARLFGKGWQNVAILIDQGTDNIKKRLGEVADAKVINQEELNKARKFRDALDNVKDKAEELAISLGEGLIPMLAKVLEIAIKIVDYLGEGWQGVKDGFESTSSTIKDVAVDLGLADYALMNFIEDVKNKSKNAHDAFHDNIIRPIDDSETALADLQTQFDALVADIKGDISLRDMEIELGNIETAAGKAFGGTREDFLNYQNDIDKARINLIELGKELDLQDQRTLKIYVDKSDLEGAVGYLKALNLLGTGMGGEKVNQFGRLVAGARAGGGPVIGGAPYLVGENGPEIFVPGSNGTIANSMATNVTVNVSGADPNAVVRALQQYVRQSGPVPVNTRAM